DEVFSCVANSLRGDLRELETTPCDVRRANSQETAPTRQETTSLRRKRYQARAQKTAAYAMDTIVPFTTSPVCRGVESSPNHARLKCVGSRLRRPPRAVIWSRMLDRMNSSTAPPTAPSGASVQTDSRNASPATTSRLTAR